MTGSFDIYVNNTEIPEDGGTFEEMPILAILVKGRVQPSCEYELVHNDEVIPMKAIGRDTLSSFVPLKSMIGYHAFQVREDGVDVFPYSRLAMTKVGEMVLEDFWAMVNHVFSDVVATTGSFVYFDKLEKRHTIRNSIFSYNWINSRMRAVEENVMAIERSMALGKQHKTLRSLSSKNIDREKTRMLIRKNPQLLVEQDTGIRIGGKNYLPSQVAIRKSETFYRTQENKQIFELIRGMHQNIQLLLELFHSRNKTVLASGTFSKEMEKCLEWENRIQYLKINTFLAKLDARDIVNIRRYPRTSLQSSNIYYSNVYNIYIEFLNKDLDISEKAIEKVYSHISGMADIYRTYCGHLLGEAFFLSPVGEALEESDEEGRIFSSEDGENIDLYHKNIPEGLIESWTSSAETPDMIMHFADRDELVLIKVSYREHEGGSTQEDRNKMSLMMNAYNIPTGVIVYPGEKFGMAEYDFKHGTNSKILEVAVSPVTVSKNPKGHGEIIRTAIETALEISSPEEYEEKMEAFSKMEKESGFLGGLSKLMDM